MEENKLQFILFILLIGLLILLGILITNSQGYSTNKSALINKIRSIKDKDKTVAFYSDVPGLSIKSNNDGFFNKKLDEVSFWEENNVDLFLKRGEKLIRAKKIEKLRIYLTPIPQLFGEEFWDDENKFPTLYQSFGMAQDKKTNTLNLLIYINPKVIKSEGLEKSSSRFSKKLLFTIWQVTHRSVKGATVTKFEGIDKYLESLNTLPYQSFVLIR